MNADAYLWITGTGLAMTGGACLWLFLGNKKEEKPTVTAQGPERKLLSEASDLWTEKVLPLSKASVLWVEEKQEKKAVPRPNFAKAEITDFWCDIVEAHKSIIGARKSAIAAILKMLDKEGDCPSVVRNPKHPDAENKFSEDVFSLLATIPLWKHTLDVARAMAQRVGTETLVADAVISGLGHDLGKIPAYHERGYSTGDHPQISAIVLGGLAEFKALTNYQELETIIRSHHHLAPSNAMANLLKTCDQIVRNQEIAVKMRQAVENGPQEPTVTPQQAESQTSTPVPPTPPAATVGPQTLPQPPTEGQQTDNPLGHKPPDKDPTHAPERVPLPWFNPDSILTELKPWINVVAQGKWGAVSMPDGLVYVNQDCLWGGLKKSASDEVLAQLLAADADEATKRSILYTVVWQLSEQRNAIAADMIDPNYYMIPVIILTGTGKPIAGQPLLIPFRAEAFGMLPSDLESLKSPNLRRMVKSIRPKRNEP